MCNIFFLILGFRLFFSKKKLLFRIFFPNIFCCSEYFFSKFLLFRKKFLANFNEFNTYGCLNTRNLLQIHPSWINPMFLRWIECVHEKRFLLLSKSEHEKNYGQNTNSISTILQYFILFSLFHLFNSFFCVFNSINIFERRT